jgi:hypothetical protein
MSILRIYVAAVCLAAIIFGLHDAPLFLRARQRLLNATTQEENARRSLKKATDAKTTAAIAASFEAGYASVDDNGNPVPKKNDPGLAAFDAAVSGTATPPQPTDPRLTAATDEEENAKAEWSGTVSEKSAANDAYEVQQIYALLVGCVFLSHALLLGVAVYRRRAVTGRPSN